MEFHSPTSFAEASALAANATGITRFLAGGTDVLVQLRSDLVTPDTLIDIKKIDGVGKITCNADGSWTLGVAVTGAEMSEHPELGRDWPGPGRGDGPDRLDPGSGARDADRQPVQRIPGG